MIAAATGHRWERLGMRRSFVANYRLRDVATACLAQLRPDAAMSGMALGWDTAWAEAALGLRIPLIAAVPARQTDTWTYSDLSARQELLRRCERVEVIGEGYEFKRAADLRNRYMVDHAQVMVAMWDGKPSGTGNCIRYAEQRGVPVVNLWGLQH